MVALQVNAFFKKAAPAKAAPAKKTVKKSAPVKKAAPIKKAAPKKTVVKKAAPVRKSSGKPSQAGGDLAKWYGKLSIKREGVKGARVGNTSAIISPVVPLTADLEGRGN